jgi:hypothetical protein
MSRIWQARTAVYSLQPPEMAHIAHQETRWSHQHIRWRIQDFQAREAGRKPAEPQLHGVLCPVQVVQVELGQPWQPCQGPQVVRAYALVINTGCDPQLKVTQA